MFKVLSRMEQQQKQVFENRNLQEHFRPNADLVKSTIRVQDIDFRLVPPANPLEPFSGTGIFT